MKTRVILASAVLALATVAACSSNDAQPTPPTPFGTVAEGEACADTSECEAPLRCLFPIADACNAKGRCAAPADCSNHTICPCGGGAAIVACVDGVFAPMPVTGNQSCAGGTETDSGSRPPGNPQPQDSGSNPPPPPPEDSGAPANDDAGPTPDAAPPPADSGPAPVDAGQPPVDAGHDSGSTPVDSGSGVDASCPFAAPGTPSTCNACATNGKTCDVNGCYGGYYCNTSTNKCVAKPTC